MPHRPLWTDLTQLDKLDKNPRSFEIRDLAASSEGNSVGRWAIAVSVVDISIFSRPFLASLIYFPPLVSLNTRFKGIIIFHVTFQSVVLLNAICRSWMGVAQDTPESIQGPFIATCRLFQTTGGSINVSHVTHTSQGIRVAQTKDSFTPL